ncbi:MAG: prepilin-type N-terminal cleavage/methylation domain-containing protein [Patescibacteria group bacterium]|jgi:prepilin-type N-terminal cleavage/methylation domain-containing protein
MIKVNNKNGLAQSEKPISLSWSPRVVKIIKKLLILKNNVTVSRTGFSLVEMLIAVSIFSVIATIASSMFSTFANNQKRTQSSQVLLNNAQYVLEIISREIKNNEIISFDTSACSSVDARYTKCLMFVRENGETAGFFYDGTYDGVSDNTEIEIDYVQLDCFYLDNVYSNCSIATGQAPVVLLSQSYNKVQITSLDFNLTPTTNPYFDDTGLNNQQPKVTVNLVVKYFSTQPIEQASHHLQTTVSSRVYKR